MISGASGDRISSIPVKSSPPSPSAISRETVTEYPMETHVASYAQTDTSSDGSVIPKPDFSNHFQLDDSSSDKTLDAGDFYFGEDKLSKTLLPQGRNDIQLKQRAVHHGTADRNRNNRVKKDSPPRPLLAVRAMELETRRKHPELAQELDNLRNLTQSNNDWVTCINNISPYSLFHGICTELVVT